MKHPYLVYLYFILSLLVSCQSAYGQQPKKEISFKPPYQFNKEIEDQIATDTVPWKYQTAAAAYAAKGDHQKALLTWDEAMGKRNMAFSQAEADSIRKLYHPVPAIPYIIKIAAEHEITIINEAHHSNLHRAFTTSLLKDLYEKGYRHLGLEALANDMHQDKKLNDRQYPIQESGWYLKAPAFGELLRQALEIGYTVFPYENTGKREEREVQQAQNIYAHMQKHPGEKVLIHCGFDHVLEGEHEAWGKAMAQELKDLSGLDPFTINQEDYSEKSEAQYNPKLLKLFDIKEASILFDRDKNAFAYTRRKSFTDVAVLHPTTTYEQGRADWLFADKQKVAIPVNGTELSFPIMLLAYKANEPIKNGIPVDIVEIANKNDTATLALSSGQYTIVAHSHTGKSICFDWLVK
ncbi:hypothetical protein GCM10011506_06810 [Marivirga lumbricoides]|uniref:Uncharacterized protein n=1 Tax=Marivirga lumbricoides TaxID=1046115 RepID=A0ABQ1LGK1_9BACT|nr:hypothetical protein GCM10011506_06810 [Marivirga lumbricoides]